MKKNSQKRSVYEITYEPDNTIKKGYLSTFLLIFNEIVKNRWLMYQLFKRNFLVLYKQSFLGIIWAVIIPFLSIGTFIILYHTGIFKVGEMLVPYPLYAILGIAFWQLFSLGLIAGSDSLVKAGPMIVKINFSKKSLVIVDTSQSIISFIIQIFIFVFIAFYYKYVLSFKILWIFLMVLPLILLTLGLSFILSLLNGIMRDISNLVSITLIFLMFLTPILYIKPQEGVLAKITAINIFYYLISAPRELILFGKVTEWKGFFISSLISLCIFITCLLIFHLTETRITERI